MAFFTEPKQKNSKICIEKQNTLNGQNNLEEKEQKWRYNAP